MKLNKSNKSNGIVLIPFNTPWDWSTDYLNQTAFELSKRGFKVICYMQCDAYSLKESIIKNKRFKLFDKYDSNIYLYYPTLFIPFRRFKVVQKINDLILYLFLSILVVYLSVKHNIKNKIIWIFYPNLLPLIKKLGLEKWKIIYDCVDFYTVDGLDNKHEIIKNEKYLCANANLVVANSHVLQKHLQKYRKNVKLVVQGFRLPTSHKKNKLKLIQLKKDKPNIGFVGGVNKRLDFEILIPLIKNNRRWNFIIWGPIQDDVDIKSLTRFSNVTYGVSSDKSEIPSLISQFDIGIIPYDLSQDFNKFCYPMKLFEYFYAGIPVISTPIEELKYFSKLVYTAKDYKGWENKIQQILSKKWSNQMIRNEKEFAKENSWENKIQQILSNLK